MNCAIVYAGTFDRTAICLVTHMHSYITGK